MPPKASITGGLGAALSLPLVSSLLSPTEAMIEQFARRDCPVFLPDVTSIWAAWQRGFVPWKETHWGLGSSGVMVDLPGPKLLGDERSLLWRGAAKLLLVRPEVQDILTGQVRGYIGDDRARTLLKQAGVAATRWEGLDQLFQSWLTPTELMEARNRGLIGTKEFYQFLKRFGGYDEKQKDIFNRLREAIPGVSDLIHFVVKEAFSPDIANIVKLYDEFPKDAKPWVESQGYFTKLGFDIISDGVRREATWLDMYWAAHWQPISPTQGYTLLHRFRPSRMSRYTDQWPDIQPFTGDDLAGWLRINDYPKSVRSWLAAAAYTPLRLIDIRRALRQGVKDPLWATINLPVPDPQPAVDRARLVTWAQEQFLDRGLAPADAALDAELSVRDAEDAQEKKGKSLADKVRDAVARRTLALFQTGVLTRPDTVQRLMDLGWPVEVAELAASEKELAERDRLIRAVRDRVKGEYVDGALSKDEARMNLVAAGIQEARADQLVRLWQAQRGAKAKEESTEKVLGWYRRRIIDHDQAVARLTNIGWREPERVLLLDEAGLLIAQSDAKAIAALARNQRQRAAELERAQRRLNAAARQAQRDLRLISPVGRLRAWLKKGVISPAFFRRRMRAMGYDLPDIELYLEEETVDVEKNGAAHGPPPQSPPAPPGGAAPGP